MIILTDEQAAIVRGVSPHDGGAMLDPVPLKDGAWMLGEQVLDDPAHADVREFLAALPKATPAKADRYDDEADKAADKAAYASKLAAAGDAKAAGVRKPVDKVGIVKGGALAAKP